MPQDEFSPRHLVFTTLSVVKKALESGDLNRVEERLSALVSEADAHLRADVSHPKGRSIKQPEQVFKVDIERRMVYGWASVSTIGGEEITDKQNDVLSVDDLREAAHDFIGKRVVGRMHEAFDDIGEVRESMVFDKGLQAALGIDLGMEGWFVGAYVKDQPTWDRVLKGELKAFSIGGTGIREKMLKRAQSRLSESTKGFRGPGQVALFTDALAALETT